MTTTLMMNIDPTTLLLKGDDVKRTFEKEWLIRLFAKHKDIPQSDVLLFLHKAQLTGANPILDQIYLIERKVKVSEYGQQDRWEKRGTVVFSYQFLNAKANETGEFHGYKIVTGPKKRFNPFAKAGEEMREELCATCTVTRNGHEFSYDAWWSEYAQDNHQWKSKPYLMLEKCAFAGALRRAFPEALSGIYIEDEMKEEDLDADIDKRRKNEAIETTANKVEERNEEISRKLASADDVDRIDATLALIKSGMSSLTSGLDLTAKGKAMVEHLGVNKFDDLKTKSLEELELKQKNIQAIIEEKISREMNLKNNSTSEVKDAPKEEIKTEVKDAKAPRAPKNQPKPSFILGEDIK